MPEGNREGSVDSEGELNLMEPLGRLEVLLPVVWLRIGDMRGPVMAEGNDRTTYINEEGLGVLRSHRLAGLTLDGLTVETSNPQNSRV